MEYAELLQLFGVSDVSDVKKLSGGHINKTLLVSCKNGKKYVLQAINNEVFRSPQTVMRNIREIEAAFERIAPCGVSVPHYLTVGSRNFVRTDGETYRLCEYIQSAKSRSDNRNFLMGYSFGVFMRTAADCRLEPVIGNFHGFSRYFSVLKSIGGDRVEPDVLAKLERLNETLSEVFTANIPVRNVHNDAKADNIIFGERCTVIDLDTTMKGYAAFDYGDMIRSVCKSPDINAITDVTHGFACGLDGTLGDNEAESLYYGVLWAVGELAVRYMTDSFRADKYFKGKSSDECFSRAMELLRQLDMFDGMKNEITDIIHREFEVRK